MKKRSRILIQGIGLLSAMLLFISASCQSPFRYWGFNGKDGLIDYIEKDKFDTAFYKTTVDIVPGVHEQGVDLSKNGQTVVVTSALRNSVKDAFSISFFFKGSSFQFQTFPKPDLLVQLGYPFLLFRTTSVIQGKPVVDNWRINLNGSGPASYSYYTDGNWHQLTFAVDLKTGRKQIYIDGKAVQQFVKNIGKGGTLELSGSDGFRNTHQLDELAFYNTAIGEQVVSREFRKFSKGLQVTANLPAVRSGVRAVEREAVNGFDPLDFAPGYPEYTTQALDQLRAFPDPRFSTSTSMPRNFPWLDITYLHRELPGAGGMGFGKTNPEKAVAMAEEMHDRWNYYYEIPALRLPAETLKNTYTKTSTVAGALIQHARKHTGIQTGAIIHQLQGKPVHAGFEEQRPNIIAQNLPDTYYIRDKNGRPVKFQNKKWISPLAPLDFVYRDARTTAFYLKHVETYLGRPLNMINENGEYFGHMRGENLLNADPAVKADREKRQMSIAQYNGWFQNRLDTAYKNEILRQLGWTDTRFTFYNVTAVQPGYWPDYALRRSSNDMRNNIHYSTPNFYPARPDNWAVTAGTLNGYGTIAEGRLAEIKLGDIYFAPFVSAGWGAEEKNIRPAQWLALLKSMVMLGAEYFHVGYFNITGTKGWPNGKGPYDPRGYVYQVAMPAYAQAIMSHAKPFFEKGELINPVGANNRFAQFRIPGRNVNELIMARKMGKEYLIFGSIQPNSNQMGNTPASVTTEIELDGMRLRLPIRKQGSVYYLNTANPEQPVFYQFDGWHGDVHPAHWNEAMVYEAEHSENHPMNWNAVRTIAASKQDFSTFQTYITPGAKDEVHYSIPASAANKKLFVLARAVDNARITMTGPDSKSANVQVNSNDWKWYAVDLPAGDKDFILKLKSVSGKAEIDKFIFTTSSLNQVEQQYPVK